MNHLLSAIAVVLSLTANQALAGNHEYKNTPEYMQMEQQTRETLKNCLNDANMKTKECIGKYKDMHKAQKKEIKKMYKEEHED